MNNKNISICFDDDTTICNKIPTGSDYESRAIKSIEQQSELIDNTILIFNRRVSAKTLKLCEKFICAKFDSRTSLENIKYLPNLKQIILSENCVMNEPNVLSDKVEYLEIQNDNYDSALDNLPHNLTHLKFSNCSKFNQPLNNLPHGLKTLQIGYAYAHNLDNLPDSLETLIIGDCSYFMHKSLHSNNSKLSILNNLPSGLKFLQISSPKNYDLCNLPNSIKVMQVFAGLNTTLKLPHDIENLTICVDLFDKCNFFEFELLCRLIICVDLQNNSNSKIKNIPNNVKDVYILIQKQLYKTPVKDDFLDHSIIDIYDTMLIGSVGMDCLLKLDRI